MERYIEKKENNEIWLSNLPNDYTLCNIINNIKVNNKNNKIIINQKIDLNNQQIPQVFTLSNIIFKEEVLLYGVTFNYDVSFKNSTFEKKASFHSAKFKNSIDFTNTNFNNEAIFDRIEFLKESKFDNATFDKNVDFTYSEFSEDASFKDATFKNKVDFKNTIFHNKVRFHHCKFHHWVEFENTTFNKLVDFYDAKFFAPQQFHLTDFMDRAIFSDATFDKEAQFIHCKVESSSTINFHSTTFNKGLDISRSNFNLCKVSFWDIRISGLNEALSSELYKNNFGDNEYLPSVPKKLCESMRFIKNNFYSENNRIEGSQFEKKELEIYRKEVKSQPNRFIKQLTGNNEPTTQWEKWLKYYDTSFILQINSLFIIGLMLFLYIISTHHLFYGATLLFFIITMGSHLTCKKQTIKNSIKQNNYIPYILILASICLYFIALYDIHHIKNNDNSIIVYITFLAIFIAFGFTYLFFNEDKILLFLNKNSNDFGVSWIVGVNFTILVGLITYLPILGYLYQNNCISFDLSINGLGNFFQNFGEILNPLKWTNLCLFNTEPTGWIYVWIFIGRIFIGYGYYQTIQAFRKYGKS